MTGQTGIPVGISGKPLTLCSPSPSRLSPQLFLLPLAPPGCSSAGVEHPPAQPAPLSRWSAVGLAGVGPFPAAISSLGCARRGVAAALGTAALVLPCPSSSPSSVGDLFRHLGTKMVFPAAAGSCLLLPERRVLLGTSSSTAQRAVWFFWLVSSSSSLPGSLGEPVTAAGSTNRHFTFPGGKSRRI